MSKYYKVITDDYLPTLEEEVTKYINEDWILHKGLVIVELNNKVHYHQVVIKIIAVVKS